MNSYLTFKTLEFQNFGPKRNGAGEAGKAAEVATAPPAEAPPAEAPPAEVPAASEAAPEAVPPEAVPPEAVPPEAVPPQPVPPEAVPPEAAADPVPAPAPVPVFGQEPWCGSPGVWWGKEEVTRHKSKQDLEAPLFCQKLCIVSGCFRMRVPHGRDEARKSTKAQRKGETKGTISHLTKAFSRHCSIRMIELN